MTTTLRVTTRWQEVDDGSDVEQFPVITAAQAELARVVLRGLGQSKLAEQAWDLVEAVYGNPPPAREYVIEITP